MESCLLLNASYEPLKIISWQHAMCLWVRERVEILETHDREAKAVRFSFRLPSVVRLLRYVHIKRQEHVAFTRANIYARDQHECQYCGERQATEDLTFDHVIPVAQGGTKSWENIVTACVDCNRRKDNRTPAEAGMPLLKTPCRPTSVLVLRMTIGLRHAPKSWADYLYWNVELDEQ